MAKKSVKFTKKMCCKALAIILAIVALIMGAFSGASYTSENTSAKINLFGMFFGKMDKKGTIAGISGVISGSGVSIAGLISFILIVIAIVILVLSFFANKQEKMLTFIGTVCLILSVILMLCLLAFGSKVTTGSGILAAEWNYSDYVKDFALGAGAWLWAIFGLVGAGAAGYSLILK